MATIRDSSVIFDDLSTKFTKLLYARTEGDSELIHKTLEDLNNLNYKHHIITNPTKGVLLINQCCTLIQPDDDILVSKCCRLVTNLVTHQHLQLEGRTLKITIDWCMKALKQVDKLIMLEILITIDALLRIDPRNTKGLLKDVLNNNSPVVLLAQNTSQEELAMFATQCLEACTITTEELQSNSEIKPHLNICSNVFMNYLNGDKNFKDLLHYKMLISCLCGIYNIVSQDIEFLNNNLGVLLGIIRSYMLYGVKGVEFIKPQKLLPSQLSIPESTICTLREKKGGKVPKLRKNKPANADNKKLESNFNGRKEYVPATIDMDSWGEPSSNLGFSKVKTSDSEVSDGETVTVAKITYLQRKIRQASLNLFLKIAKTVDKRTMFSYWSSFIPDGSPSGTHSICACILKDPSPSTRSMALNVLLTLLSTSKLFLSHAESSEKSTAFTPFSVTLGSMILEMHRCLRFALNENSIPVLMQVLRCLAELVQASPYHKLTPGTITKVVRSVKVFLDHKDSGIQIRAFIVLGCILASEPVVPETITILSKCSVDKDKFLGYTSGSASESKISPEDIEYANFSTDDEETEPELKTLTEMPWILKVYLRCLGVVINSAGDCVKSNYTVSPLVKLEALQVLQVIPRNYFTTLIAPYLHHIAKALENTLSLKSERQADLKLHAGNTLDSIGQAMSSYFANNPDRSFLSIEQGLVFWNNLLGGALPTLLSDEKHPILRAVGCNCLGSIGADIFERLTKDKQMLVIMSLLGCSRDEDSGVRGAAVRALAISVVYPSLREDSGFVLDTAETICRTMQDSNVIIRGKASWSLANLSSALVLNKDNPNLVEDVPEDVLIGLIKYSIKGCKDNDRVKANTVRALGNLLQLLSGKQLEKDEFKNNCLEGIKSLIHCASVDSNMKVRWNSCHSLGKILSNEAINIEVHHWQKSMFDNLMNLVVGFKHFKVRISAAFALSCVSKRCNYGEYYFPTWKALLEALESSENMEDFTEYKHRDNLVDQICLSIGHLTNLLTVEDIHFLEDDVVFYSDLLKCNIQKVYDRVVPEKASGLVSAEEHLKELLPNLQHNEQKQTLQSLINAFHIDKI